MVSEPAPVCCIRRLTRVLVRGITGWLRVCFSRFLNWMNALFFLICSASTLAFTVSSSSGSESYWPADSRISSSRSSSSKRCMMSGSMKSAMFLPSTISGITTRSSSSAAESTAIGAVIFFTPAPAGMKGGLSLLSRGVGVARWSLFSMSGIFLLFIFTSTRWLSNSSHALVFTSITPSSVTVLMGITIKSSSSSLSISCLASSLNSATGMMSILLRATINGLLVNRGLMLSNSCSCSSMLRPHCSEISITYSTAARRWARAVMACISMVFLSSSGWSRIPGVSITCQRRYL